MSERADVEGNDPTRLTARRIVQRLPLYFALALGGIAVVVVLLAIQIYFGIGEISAGWWGFVSFSGAFFWIVVRGSRPLWIRSGFWLLLVAFLVIHCSVFVAILRAYPDWRPIWFVPIVIVEAQILDVMCVLLFREKRARKRRPERL
jgi:hypothetical protein